MSMTAFDYFKVRARMCTNCLACTGCPISSVNNGRNVSCTTLEHVYTKEAIDKVKQWGIENPVVTNFTKLKQVFGETYANNLYLKSDDTIEDWFYSEYKGG